jgi:hypothetical protein
MFDAKFLFASLIWGSVGFGYWVYGKKQQSSVCMIGGAAMIFVSYLIDSALLMSLVSLGLMVGIYFLRQRES